MADGRTKRVSREIADVLKDKASNIVVVPVEPDNIMHLKGTFNGPEGTPYQGGVYDVDIVIPPTYPFAPLKMKFITKIYHPNISSASGAICLDILKDAWTPVFTLRSTLVSLQSLLCSPEPNDPQDAEVAKHYIRDRKGFEDTAKYWTEIYARPQEASSHGKSASTTESRSSRRSTPTPDEIKVHGLDPDKVASFVNMGFPKADVIAAMRKLNYRGANAANVGEDAVLNALLGG